MKRFWMATAATALSVGTLVGVATPASAQDRIVGEYRTSEECDANNLVQQALFPIYDYYCEEGSTPGYTVWFLYREQ